MDLSLATKIIYEAKELGVNSLKFNGRGESTLHPDFFKVTHLAKSLASGSTFIDRITNSNFKFQINREDIFQGLCNQTKVKVSFDSFQKEVFEKQRVGNNFEKCLALVDKFHSYPGRDNQLVIQAVRTNLNINEDLEGEIKKRWPSATASIRDVVSGRKTSNIEEFEHRKRDFANRKPCLQAFVRLVIHWDGMVSACCPDISGKIVLGNTNKQHIGDIFNGPVAKKLRQDLKSKQAFLSEPCKSCSSFESFKGRSGKWSS